MNFSSDTKHSNLKGVLEYKCDRVLEVVKPGIVGVDGSVTLLASRVDTIVLFLYSVDTIVK